MASKEAISQRRGRRLLEEFIDREFDRLKQTVERTRLEMKRVLEIAEKEHRIHPKPSRYWKKTTPKRQPR